MPDNTQYTRCPECSTAFKVTDKMLSMAKGKVRCGACLVVFQATDFILKAKSKSPLAAIKPATIVAPPLQDTIKTDPLNQKLISNKLEPKQSALNFNEPERKTNTEVSIESKEALALQGSEALQSKNGQDFNKGEEVSLNEDLPAFNISTAITETSLPRISADDRVINETFLEESDYPYESESDRIKPDNFESENKETEVIEEARVAPMADFTDPPEIEPSIYDESNLEDPDFDEPDLSEPDIEDHRVDDPDLNDPNLDNTNLDNTNLDNANLDNLELEDPVFDDPDFDHSDLENFELEDFTPNEPIEINESIESDPFDEDIREYIPSELESLADDEQVIENIHIDDSEFIDQSLSENSPSIEEMLDIDIIDEKPTNHFVTTEHLTERDASAPLIDARDEYLSTVEEDDFKELADTLANQIHQADTDPDPLDEFEERVEKKKTSLRTGIVFAVLFISIGILSLKFWGSRQALAWDKTWGPATTAICAILPCDLKARQDVTKIKLHQRVVEPLENNENRLSIKLLLTNDAEFDQPYPIITIRFSSPQGESVATKRFLPKDYFPEKHSQLMPADTEIHIRFETELPHPNALGFEFNFE